MANRSIPGTSHLQKTFRRTEFLTATCPEARLPGWPAMVLDSGKVHGSWRRSRAASPGTGPGEGSFPSSADKLHSCGVTCQHLHCGSPETNQECSACQTVALSHYIKTTFLREPWALGGQEEREILSRSDPQPCKERQTTAVKPDLQLKEKIPCKNVLNPQGVCYTDTTLISNNSHGIQIR